jgi:hypothetical protein
MHSKPYHDPDGAILVLMVVKIRTFCTTNNFCTLLEGFASLKV